MDLEGDVVLKQSYDMNAGTLFQFLSVNFLWENSFNFAMETAPSRY